MRKGAKFEILSPESPKRGTFWAEEGLGLFGEIHLSGVDGFGALAGSSAYDKDLTFA